MNKIEILEKAALLLGAPESAARFSEQIESAMGKDSSSAIECALAGLIFIKRGCEKKPMKKMPPELKLSLGGILFVV